MAYSLMESLAVELDGEGGIEPEVGLAAAARLSLAERLAAYLELTKPRITLLIVLTAAAGFCLGARGPLSYISLLHAMAGVCLLSSGIAALNQYLERDLDGLMRRTSARPLPSRRITPGGSLIFGAGLTLAAEVYLALLTNVLTAALGLAVIAGYLLLYTP